uniref:RING-type domain-containing protein n=1 Tax=Oryza nivara TaxID=4536 RepID=A0A0E0I592_ORYNI
MGRSFRDSLKVLEADIQHANSLAAEFRREYDGACLQMRMSYCPAAHFFLFLVQWTDCNLAGALGLLRILIYKVYADGTTTMSAHERKASIREFYAVIFPSLMQLHEGINEVEDKKQKAICIERYRRRDEDQKMVISEIDDNIEEECGICMEINGKVVLPTCSHAMCIKCYRDWDIVDMATVRKENLRRLFMYIDKLPTVIPETVFDVYDSHKLWSPWCSCFPACKSCKQLSSPRRLAIQSGLLGSASEHFRGLPEWSSFRVKTPVGAHNRDIVDMATVRKENLRRLFMYIDKLPTVIPETVFDVYDSHKLWSPWCSCFPACKSCKQLSSPRRLAIQSSWKKNQEMEGH